MAPDPQPSARAAVQRPRRSWVRIAAVIGALVWAAVAAVIVAFTSVASASFGWGYAALVFLPGLVGAAWLLGLRGRALVAAAVPALALGIVMFQWAPPDHGRVRHVAEDLGVNREDWDLVGDDESGTTWCWDGCPAVSFFYLTPEPPKQAVETFTARLRADGWSGGTPDLWAERPPGEYTERALEVWRKGRWSVMLRVPAEKYPPQWATGADPGLTPVEISYTAD